MSLRSFRVMSDGSYYGCCACIGAAGLGLIAKMALPTMNDGFAINLYIDGVIESYTPSGKKNFLNVSSNYPVSGSVKITLMIDSLEGMRILLRNPAWSRNTGISVNGEECSIGNGYIQLDRVWKDGDVIELSLDMRTEALYPISYGHEILMNKVVWGINYMVPTYDEEDPMAKCHVALRLGPVILAQENRLGYSVDTLVHIVVNNYGFVDTFIPEKKIAPYKNMIEACVPLENGNCMHVTDYASAGKTLDEKSKMAAWMLTDGPRT